MTKPQVSLMWVSQKRNGLGSLPRFWSLSKQVNSLGYGKRRSSLERTQPEFFGRSTPLERSRSQQALEQHCRSYVTYVLD